MSVSDKYLDIVADATVKAGAIGVPGVLFPPGDIAAMGGIWALMARDIARVSGHPIDKQYASKLAIAAGAGAGAYLAGSKLFSRVLIVVPGGIIAAAGINSTLNALYTWQLGEVFVDLFDEHDFSDDVLSHLATAVMGMKPSPKSFAALVRALQKWFIGKWRRGAA